MNCSGMENWREREVSNEVAQESAQEFKISFESSVIGRIYSEATISGDVGTMTWRKRQARRPNNHTRGRHSIFLLLPL